MEKQKVNGGKDLDWDINGNIMLSLKSKTKKKWIMVYGWERRFGNVRE